MLTNIGHITASDASSLLKMWNVTVPAGKRPLYQHSHIYFEISLVESGSGQYTVGDTLHPMKEGDVFVFACNEHHSITTVDNSGLTLLNLHFDPRYLWGYSADSLSEESINLCFTHNQAFTNRINAEKAEKIRNLLLSIKQEFLLGEKEYRLTVKSLLNLILIHLIRDFDYIGNSLPISRDRLHSIRRVIKHIDNHLTEELTLSELSEIAGMSANYFSSLFHQVSGITLWDYISSKRIDLSLKLLKEDDRNILETALSCGFNNTANFNKAFKKATGLTPSEYRNSTDIML